MSIKNNLQKNAFPLLMGLFLACAVATIVEVRFKVIQRAYDRFVLDNRNHYLSCQDLPPRIEVERAMEQHRDVIQQIEQVAPGFVGVEVDSLTCDGKADLLIWYGTHEQRVAVEKLIGSNTFYGIPYRLQNR